MSDQDHKIVILSVFKLKLKSPEQLLEMLKSQQKNRSTMVYYLLLQKSQRGLLTTEEQQIIDAELVKRKEAMQSTLDFLSKQQKLKKTVAAPSHSEENSAATHGNLPNLNKGLVKIRRPNVLVKSSFPPNYQNKASRHRHL